MSSVTQLVRSRSAGFCDVLSCLGRPASLRLSLVICEMGMRWVTFQSHHKDSLGEVSGGALRTVGGAVKVMPFTLGLPWAHSPGAASLVRLELCVWPGGSSHLERMACRHIWILEIPFRSPTLHLWAADSRNPMARLWRAARVRSGQLSTPR